MKALSPCLPGALDLPDYKGSKCRVGIGMGALALRVPEGTLLGSPPYCTKLSRYLLEHYMYILHPLPDVSSVLPLCSSLSSSWCSLHPPQLSPGVLFILAVMSNSPPLASSLSSPWHPIHFPPASSTEEKLPVWGEGVLPSFCSWWITCIHQRGGPPPSPALPTLHAPLGLHLLVNKTPTGTEPCLAVGDKLPQRDSAGTWGGGLRSLGGGWLSPGISLGLPLGRASLLVQAFLFAF